MCVCSVKPPLYRFAFFCVVCVHAAVCEVSVSVVECGCKWTTVSPLHGAAAHMCTYTHTHTQSLTHILFILTQTRLLGEFMYESRFCSPGTVRLSYISQCPVPSIHPPNFSAYPIQGHGGPVIEQEPVYTLRCHDIYSSTGFGIIHLFSHTKQNTRFILFLSYVWFHFCNHSYHYWQI